VIGRLVRRSLGNRPGRSALLLLGYGLGVGVTIALLSIGTALLDQARDRELAGGGDLTVVPQGVDLETLRTASTGSIGLTLRQARFLYRQVLAGPRFAGRVRGAAPWIDDRLVYLVVGDDTVAVSAGGEIPDRSAALGAAPELTGGAWPDLAADRRWTSPGDSALYAEIDAFHLPPPAARGDSTWAEWHYVNVLFPDRNAALYLTFLVGGRVPDGRWGGRVLGTWQEGGRSRTFEEDVPAGAVRFSLRRPDLRLGADSIRLDGAGRYHVTASVPVAADATGSAGGGAAGAGPDADVVPRESGGRLRVHLVLDPGVPAYLPPLDVSSGGFVSGYVAPVLRGRARGTVCAGSRCIEFSDAPAYHDHNWGVWRDVTWNWGHADLGSMALLYGGVRGPDGRVGRRFLYLVDGRGFLGLLRIDSLRVTWDGKRGGRRRPSAIRLVARSGEDSVAVDVRVRAARSTAGAAGGMGSGARFWQILGNARLSGRLHGFGIAASGPGTFETWTTRSDAPSARGDGNVSP
jgi:hypothetical protein